MVRYILTENDKCNFIKFLLSQASQEETSINRDLGYILALSHCYEVGDATFHQAAESLKNEGLGILCFSSKCAAVQALMEGIRLSCMDFTYGLKERVGIGKAAAMLGVIANMEVEGLLENYAERKVSVEARFSACLQSLVGAPQEDTLSSLFPEVCDQVGLLVLLLRTAKADGIKMTAESEFISILEKVYQLEKDVVEKAFSLYHMNPQLVPVFSSVASSRNALREAIRLGTADKVLVDLEKAELERMAGELGIVLSREALDELSSLTKERAEVEEKGDEAYRKWMESVL